MPFRAWGKMCQNFHKQWVKPELKRVLMKRYHYIFLTLLPRVNIIHLFSKIRRICSNSRGVWRLMILEQKSRRYWDQVVSIWMIGLIGTFSRIFRNKVFEIRTYGPKLLGVLASIAVERIGNTWEIFDTSTMLKHFPMSELSWIAKLCGT